MREEAEQSDENSAEGHPVARLTVSCSRRAAGCTAQDAGCYPVRRRQTSCTPPRQLAG